MLIDSTKLMWIAFQSARYGLARTSRLCALLDKVLDKAAHERNLIVEVPDERIGSDNVNGRPGFAVSEGQPTCFWVPPGKERVFSLAHSVTHELQRQHGMGALEALKVIGYAFHVMPRILRSGEPLIYELCYRRISGYWDTLLPETRQTFCEGIGVDPHRFDPLDPWTWNGRRRRRWDGD